MTEKILILDFGSQYTQLIARAVREANVYCEIVPYHKEISYTPDLKGIILSGSPFSVNDPNAPLVDIKAMAAQRNVLGICYGAQLIAEQLGGKVSRGGRGEYGRTVAQRIAGAVSQLLKDDIPAQLNVWMSHFDAVSVLPSGFVATASTRDAPMAVIENPSQKIWGVQYHPEVAHTEHGQSIIEQFLHQLVGAKRDWTMSSIVEDQVAAIRAQVGDERVICGLSGGVDSAVAAALVHKAVGKQLTCIYVDIGLMRKNHIILIGFPHFIPTFANLFIHGAFLANMFGTSDF